MILDRIDHFTQLADEIIHLPRSEASGAGIRRPFLRGFAGFSCRRKPPLACCFRNLACRTFRCPCGARLHRSGPVSTAAFHRLPVAFDTSSTTDLGIFIERFDRISSTVAQDQEAADHFARRFLPSRCRSILRAKLIDHGKLAIEHVPAHAFFDTLGDRDSPSRVSIRLCPFRAYTCGPVGRDHLRIERVSAAAASSAATYRRALYRVNLTAACFRHRATSWTSRPMPLIMPICLRSVSDRNRRCHQANVR